MDRVCVQGLGFVGAAMAAALACARDKNGSPCFDVVGVDLPTKLGNERIDEINSGRFPFETTDGAIHRAVKHGRDIGNLRASADPSEYGKCDIAVVDVQLDVNVDATPPTAKFEGFLAAIRTLGDHIRSGSLVIIETTVPPGTTSKLVVAELRKGLEVRGVDPESVLIAHSYERVMPGRDYLKSITNFWRVYAGHTPQAADACERFLRKLINADDYPLTRLAHPIDSETAKLMENSFRAVNIAFIEEWARFAERAGVNLPSVIQAIQMRPTHRNIMRPGFGVGGYCLTKDPLLLGVGARELFGFFDLSFPFNEAAVRVNREMPRATLALLRSILGVLMGKQILLLGATYREGVSDTRNSASSYFISCAEEEGVVVDIHDPFTDELEDIGRKVRRLLPNPDGYDAVVFAVAHDTYRELDPKKWIGTKTPLIVDANNVLSAEQTCSFGAAGCQVKAVGRGDL
jgi:UDP-N-acetyl-D-glucosamine dehydrogenase